MTVLIIGTGFIGDAVTSYLRAEKVEVIQSSRVKGNADRKIANGEALDTLLGEQSFTQVIAVGQMADARMDWIFERVDGPRWLVFSSLQVTSLVRSPGADLAVRQEAYCLDRGACVLRPTMVYGRGRDQNVTRLIRLIGRFHLAVLPGGGSQCVQPLHVEDLCGLVSQHRARPIDGLHIVAGAEPLPVAELAWTIGQVLGIRCLEIAIPSVLLRWGADAAPWFGLRTDQINRLTETKTADISLTTATFGWYPEALGVRIEQACREAAPPFGRLAGVDDRIRYLPTQPRPLQSRRPPPPLPS